MAERTDKPLRVIVILLALLEISQTTVLPRNRLLGTIGLLVGSSAIFHAILQIVIPR